MLNQSVNDIRIASDAWRQNSPGVAGIRGFEDFAAAGTQIDNIRLLSIYEERTHISAEGADARESCQ